MTLGITVAAFSFMVTSYFVIESRRQLLLTALLGMAGLLPFLWLSLGREGHSPILVQSLFILNLVIWLLFTMYIAMIVFRSIMSARHIRSNEIYVYVATMIARFVSIQTSSEGRSAEPEPRKPISSGVNDSGVEGNVEGKREAHE